MTDGHAENDARTAAGLQIARAMMTAAKTISAEEAAQFWLDGPSALAAMMVDLRSGLSQRHYLLLLTTGGMLLRQALHLPIAEGGVE